MKHQAVALITLSILLAGALAVGSEDAPTASVLENARLAGPNALVPAPGVPESGGKYRDWTLKNGNLVPEGWTLNAWFKGELEVIEEDAADVPRCLRICAPKERDSHIELPPVPSDWAKTYHAVDFKVRYRGGPVLLAAYEYTIPGKSPAVVTVETSLGPVKDAGDPNRWLTFECRYFMPDVPFRLALGVAAGGTAEIGTAEWVPLKVDVEGGGQWLNARDFGATGSAFETTAKVTAESRQIEVADAGDFEPGQTVAISKCCPQYAARTVRGPTDMYGKCDLAFDDALEVRGFDGSGGDWLVFIVELTAVNPRRFRWSDDLARSWKGTDVPVTDDWQPLSGGLEVRFKQTDKLLPGHVLSVSARTQLYTIIERIEGNTVWLRDVPTRSTEEAVMRHMDTHALQRAIDVAVKLKRNLFIPDGHYRLHRGLTIRHANVTIEGRSGEGTLMDISDGQGAVFSVHGGVNVTVRNLKMIGHTSVRPGNRAPWLM